MGASCGQFFLHAVCDMADSGRRMVTLDLAVVFLIAGARQEQDIFVRLIDSVTKQVGYVIIFIGQYDQVYYHNAHHE